MRRNTKSLGLFVLAFAVFFFVPGLLAQSGLAVYTGTLPTGDGATYLIEVPPNWNGTLFLYSHGYVAPDKPNPALDAGDMATEGFMLASGFALAGSSYAHKGWAVQEALVDQIAVLDTFNQVVGLAPARTIAWGHSLGGMITAGLIQRNPDRFAGALPMCGVLSGGVATWNTALDSTFAFKELIARGSTLQLVNITNPAGNLGMAEGMLATAQTTAQGRARLALAAALGDLPGWFDPASPEPAATDFTTQEANQFLWDAQVDFPFVFALRAELEFRAGGNPSSNVGVDYRKQLAHSVDAAEVRALYGQAGLDLEADLVELNGTVRITADPGAREYLGKNIIYDGDIHIPVLTLHTTGDGLVVVENESAYRQVVREDGNQDFLRRTFVSRAGHCTFTPAETIAAVQTLLKRLDTGAWPGVEANTLNRTAASLGPLNIVPPAFVDFNPPRYLRPFDGEAAECETGRLCGDLTSMFRVH